MASVLKLRRGNRIQNNVFTGAEGELSYDSTAKKIRVHDGITLGGKMLASEIVSVNDFGAVGDGVTDDTAAIQAAINSGAKVVDFEQGKTYLVNDMLSLVNNVSLRGNKAVIYTPTPIHDAGTGVFTIDSGDPSMQLSNISISNFKFIGKSTFSEHRHIIAIHGGNNISITDNYFYGFPGDAIYINGGDGYAAERHNYHVKISNNIIDGVNYENRNAVSILDCDGLIISDNIFSRCSRADMPGAIDIEPNPGAYTVYAIVRNILINSNVFDRVKGANGDISIVLSTGFTTYPSNIVINNNVSNSISAFGQSIAFYCQVPTSVDNFAVVSNHITNNSIGVSNESILRNTVFSSNIAGNFYVDTGGSAGYLVNCHIVNNRFKFLLATSHSNDHLVVAGNIIDQLNYSGAAVSINLYGTYLNVQNNITANSKNAQSIVMRSNSPKTNIFKDNNLDIAPSIHAFKTDDCRNVTNTTTALTFNTDTLPSVFPIGESTAYLNGDTGLPSGYGSTIGTLKCYNYSGIRANIYQHFYPYQTSLSLGAYFIREALQASDSWTGWYLINTTAV